MGFLGISRVILFGHHAATEVQAWKPLNFMKKIPSEVPTCANYSWKCQEIAQDQPKETVPRIFPKCSAASDLESTSKGLHL